MVSTEEKVVDKERDLSPLQGGQEILCSSIRHNAAQAAHCIEKCLSSLYNNHFQQDFHMHSSLREYGNPAGKSYTHEREKNVSERVRYSLVPRDSLPLAATRHCGKELAKSILGR